MKRSGCLMSSKWHIVSNDDDDDEDVTDLIQPAPSLYHLVCYVGSRPSDHYFRSVCLSDCLSVCLSGCLFVCAEFFSAVFDPISIKVGHMLYVWV